MSGFIKAFWLVVLGAVVALIVLAVAVAQEQPKPVQPNTIVQSSGKRPPPEPMSLQQHMEKSRSACARGDGVACISAAIAMKQFALSGAGYAGSHSEQEIVETRQRGFDLLTASCANQNFDHCGTLGIYLTDPVKGAKYLAMSCEGGVDKSCDRLAHEYLPIEPGIERKSGIEASYEKTIHWFGVSCGRKNISACIEAARAAITFYLEAKEKDPSQLETASQFSQRAAKILDELQETEEVKNAYSIEIRLINRVIELQLQPNEASVEGQ